MNNENTIFWNVDTQYDFIDPNGLLPVGEEQEGAREIEDALARVTETARDYDITVVNTADWHTEESSELSDNPDFRETFPPHCMANTEGAEYIDATEPKDPFYIHWDEDLDEDLSRHDGDFVVYKDAFDVFAGEPEAPHTENLLNELSPDNAVVYGVATDVCVDYAVKGLLERDINVYIVEDAVKGIDSSESRRSLDSWNSNGVENLKSDQIDNYLTEV